MYLLDTNHCSRIIQGNPTLLQCLQERSEIGVATSVITCGELRYMARKSEQEQSNLERIEAFLQIIDIYGVNRPIANIYGNIKGDLINRLGPREKAQRRRVSIQDLGVSDNDLWIASIALHYCLTIVSSNSDFQRIKQVTDFSLENWLSQSSPDA